MIFIGCVFEWWKRINLGYTEECQIISAEGIRFKFAKCNINGFGKGYWQMLKPQGERLLGTGIHTIAM